MNRLFAAVVLGFLVLPCGGCGGDSGPKNTSMTEDTRDPETKEVDDAMAKAAQSSKKKAR